MMINAPWVDTFFKAVLVGMAIGAVALPDSREVAFLILQKICEEIDKHR
jgi:hypothetical protein